MALILARVTPDPAILADQVRAHPSWRGARIKTNKLFGDLAVEIARVHAMDYFRELVTEPLVQALVEFVASWGGRPAVEGEEQAEWDSAIDDEVASVFEPYADNVSAGWLGEATVETMLHMPGEVQNLAQRFATEAWKQLTYKRTNNQILAGIGLVADTLNEFVNESEDKMELPNVNAVLNKIMTAMPDEEDLEDNIDQASDTDDILMAGAAERLGIDVSEALLLRVARAGGVDPQDWVQAIVAGELLSSEEPIEPETPQSVHPTVPPPPTITMVPAGTVKSAAQATAGRVPPPPPVRDNLPPPSGTVGASKRGRKAATVDVPQDYIPANVLKVVKDFSGLKDDALATMVGVSRPTMNNYLRGKGYCTPTAAQRASLLALIEGKATALEEAVTLLKG